MDQARASIFEKYHLAPDALLGQGMEAEVYAYGGDAVLKLHTTSASYASVRVLKEFYDALDRRRVPYALPQIHSIVQEGDSLVTIEQRLAGAPLASVLPSLTAKELDAAMHSSLTAALALTQLQLPTAFDRYKILDTERISRRSSGDWYAFLARYLSHTLRKTSPYLRRDVRYFSAKIEQLLAILQQAYGGENRLIHGDFFPGNLLVTNDLQITAVLDFGMWTMYGDYLFDIAIGWVIFDMYDDLKAGVRERYLSIILDRLGADVRGTLYRYVLLYSILSANAYSPNCSDGHYRWCVDNLNNRLYWKAIE